MNIHWVSLIRPFLIVTGKEVALTKNAEGITYAKDKDKRYLCSSLSAHYDAKNRVGLPARMPMPVNNGFEVLWKAYNKCFDQKPEEVYQECLEQIKKVQSEDMSKSMIDYVEANKDKIAILRSTLIRIKELTGDNDEQQ